MADKQGDHELLIFGRFVEVCGLPIARSSIEKREPPEPDIHCQFEPEGCAYFELVEIVDADLARAVGNQIKFQGRLLDAARRVQGLSDALVFVKFVPTSTNAQRDTAVPGIAALLEGLAKGFQGDATL